MDTWRHWCLTIGMSNLRGESLRLLFLMLSTIEAGDYIPLTPSRIQKIKRTSLSGINRALNELIEYGYITKVYEAGGGKLIGYRLTQAHKN
jgi:predicted transcriptional regulator